MVIVVLSAEFLDEAVLSVVASDASLPLRRSSLILLSFGFIAPYIVTTRLIVSTVEWGLRRSRLASFGLLLSLRRFTTL